MAAQDSSDGFTTPVPAKIDTRRALPFSDGVEDPIPPTPVKPRPLSGDATGGAAVLREFIEDCKTILRDPGHRAGIIQQDFIPHPHRALMRGSCLRLLEESATVSEEDGRRAWLVICRAVARRRRPWVSHGYLFETTPSIELLEGVDPEPFIKGFMQHHSAISSELRPGIVPDDVWGAGFALDLLTLRMCPTYYQDLLHVWLGVKLKNSGGQREAGTGLATIHCGDQGLP
ncbi:hypothetical protein CYMTET_7132 [Cymbomonas tetramitiformis]|uniref:Uncharacterized protein n=1 Tax=Cymbomonas tetramitiformis TaxID=36881 RepID=A0AAE0GXI6_9CHLO|nr:hypothetical protein CYMTET_7132 [Cymbomonas tetramitiformis]